MHTPNEQLDRAVLDLTKQKDVFARQSIDDRITLIRQLRASFPSVVEGWIDAACTAKGLTPGTPQSGEEWLGGPMVVLRNLRLLENTLISIKNTGGPPLPSNAIKVLPDGRVRVRAFPTSTYDKLLFMGFSADVWMTKDININNIREHIAVEYKGSHSNRTGKVALVLGAGNVASIGPMDVLYKLFAEGQVCILKMNPVNEYLGPFIERGLAPLVERGFLRVVYGGADVGGYLCSHPGVEEIHITGSDKTHDAIVWGPPGPDREARKRENRPLLTKRITSELGNVSPVIVVPGPWSDADFRFQAENITAMVANNASFNCNAAKLIVQHQGWDKRQHLMERVRQVLSEVPLRKAYYPGAQERYDQFLTAHPEAMALGNRTTDVVPWTVIEGLDPNKKDEMAFSTEAFCGVLTETALDAPDIASFLDKAVSFCNERVWGTLNVMLIVHPKTESDPAFAAALERAVANLRYGTIGINHWPAINYGMTSTPWGAYVGHTLDDIQSGIGIVHNTFLLEGVEKTVLRGPFRVNPKPPWFPTNKLTHVIGEKLTAFEQSPSIGRFLSVVTTAMRA
ncbi:MAG: aldehyde dehydrogenase family protein [Myxococcales bacterium]|nr:aldehyde dehydrogenase family protein [Myxococcales bacterium]